MSTTPIQMVSAEHGLIEVPPGMKPETALLIAQARHLGMEMDPKRPDRLWVKTDHLITEDDTPVESFYQLLQMWLLTESLTSSWSPGRPFIVGSDVAMFFVNRNPPIVPDVFLSMDVSMSEISQNDPKTPEGKSYLFWEMGKGPEVVIEIVSNREGNELTSKRKIYAENVKAPYYIVWDPHLWLKGERLTIFRLAGKDYCPTNESWMADVGLGVRVWSGSYREYEGDWLRWYGSDDQLIPTGDEQRRRADASLSRAEQLAAKLRELGINPDNITGTN